MFEHWKAYKNRQNENLNGDPTTAKHSRAESFASLVSVIRNSIQGLLPMNHFRLKFRHDKCKIRIKQRTFSCTITIVSSTW